MNRALRRTIILTVVPMLLVASACEGDSAGGGGDVAPPGDDVAAPGDDAAAPGGDAAAEPLGLIGSYTDAWGTAHEISAASWTQTYPGSAPMVFHVAQFDNAAGWVVAQNDAANEFSAGLWSRFDWLRDGDALWYCQSAYDAASEEAAVAAPAADRADPASSGCGGFGWTNLTP
jgi:hypothetical protein